MFLFSLLMKEGISPKAGGNLPHRRYNKTPSDLKAQSTAHTLRPHCIHSLRKITWYYIPLKFHPLISQ
ncbi:hypothetical protein A4A49_10211 [Nicotiana attenuata]|uniref:Uncharacterized protein n=1 Tax=Nicotiana attenuata TaxID=49451 RepID=A0A1J6IZZ1_NICAT|nr:hypothetical protein A4A49_10211 [Nicotiana attenuata]